MQTNAEVDRLKEVYGLYAAHGLQSSRWSAANPGNQAIQREREAGTRRLLQSSGFLPLGTRRILDVGCGTGEKLAGFLEWGALPENLVGVDLIAERIRAAQRNYPELTFQLANAESLPATARSFDLVLVFTVFTSILDSGMAANICGEIDRVLAPGGGVVWYDFRIHNPWNRNVRGLNRARIRELFPGYRHSLRSITLLPPLARRLGRFTPLLYRRLSAWPFLRTHYLGLLTKS